MDGVYRNRRYLELADQIENHSRAMGYLLIELNQEFPPKPGETWVVQPDHRPQLVTDQHGKRTT